MRLKARKRSNKRLVQLLSVYDADSDEIRCLWLSMPYAVNCPIIRTCLECGRCKL